MSATYGVISNRRQWLRVETAANEHGTYDVVLRLDGSYVARGDAEDAAKGLGGELAAALSDDGLDLSRMVDWR